jgi:hypothetical protein
MNTPKTHLGFTHSDVAAETASASPDLYEAMLADVATLLGAVAPVGGDVVLIASEARGKMMAARSRGGVLPLTFGSPAVAAEDPIAVAVDGLAVALDAAPEVRASHESVVHMDTAPAAIVGGSAPGTPAYPTRSIWQTDSVSMRLRLGATWAIRHANAVAWLTTSW